MEKNPFLSHSNIYTLAEAALILAHESPHDTNKLYSDCKANNKALSWYKILCREILTGNLESYAKKLTIIDTAHGVPIHKDILSSDFDLKYESNISPEKSYIERDDLLEWLEFTSRNEEALIFKHQTDELQELVEATRYSLIASNKPNLLANLNHFSENLSILHLTATKFWENFDPQNPPSSKKIKHWLETEFEASNTLREGIDIILRPNKFKRGGKSKNSAYKVPNGAEK